MPEISILPDSLVSTAWLEEHLGAPGLAIVDIRGYVNSTDVGGGRQTAVYLGAGDEYAAGHIPGSVFVDWTRDIVDLDNPVPAQIASPAVFAEAMSTRGIGNETDVVVVDHSGGHFATRLWWALRYYGHDRVALLDGGFNKWTAENRRVVTDVPSPAAATFRTQVRGTLVADADQVNALIGDESVQVVDARDAETFSGVVFRGARAGHIPGAINVPAKALFAADGTWKELGGITATLNDFGLDPGKPVVAYCNGGVTATAVLFALARTGRDDFANYDGSWNEWSAIEALPVETSLGE